MNKEELRLKFEKNVEYLAKNVPPDDIYIFAEQTFMACLFFMYRWNQWVDIEEECAKDEITKKWVNNILGFQKCKDEGVDIESLDLNLRSIEDDE